VIRSSRFAIVPNVIKFDIEADSAFRNDLMSNRRFDHPTIARGQQYFLNSWL